MIVPLLHRIIVKPEKFHESNKDMIRAREIGLVIPELEDMKRAQASVDRGIVVSLGETAYKDYGVEPPIKAGDLVNYAKFAGKLIEDDGETYICLNDEDVICVIEG